MKRYENFSIAKLIDEMASNVERTAEKVKDRAALFDKITEAMPPDALYSVTVDEWGTNYYVSGDVHDLAGAIRALRVNGFKSDAKPPTKNDASWSAYYHDEKQSNVSLHFTSKICKRVKIGTRMVEQDVYETVCESTVRSVA